MKYFQIVYAGVLLGVVLVQAATSCSSKDSEPQRLADATEGRGTNIPRAGGITLGSGVGGSSGDTGSNNAAAGGAGGITNNGQGGGNNTAGNGGLGGNDSANAIAGGSGGASFAIGIGGGAGAGG